MAPGATSSVNPAAWKHASERTSPGRCPRDRESMGSGEPPEAGKPVETTPDRAVRVEAAAAAVPPPPRVEAPRPPEVGLYRHTPARGYQPPMAPLTGARAMSEAEAFFRRAGAVLLDAAIILVASIWCPPGGDGSHRHD